MTIDALARELSARLNEVLPAGFRVRVDGTDVIVDAPDGLGFTTYLCAVNADEYAGAAQQLLSGIQDLVCQTTATPWPRARGPRLNLAMPDAALVGNELRCWFGSVDHPVLTLRSIPILKG